MFPLGPYTCLDNMFEIGQQKDANLGVLRFEAFGVGVGP
jgi:hypothetical protein